MAPLTIAIGDIHGCLPMLSRLVGTCLRNADESPNFVFLGDYTDRGPDSRGVIVYLMELQARLPGRVVCLRGNHEAMLIDAVDDPQCADHWLRNGGRQTLASYAVSEPAQIDPAHLDWMQRLPLFLDDGLRFFVHAGVRPGVARDAQSDHDLCWIREPFLSSREDFGRLIVHGHSPLRGGKPEVRPNRINLDTAAVFGGALTAAIFNDRQASALRFIQQRASRKA